MNSKAVFCSFKFKGMFLDDMILNRILIINYIVMKLKLPEYLLCEDPTSTKETLFIYYVPTRSLVRVIHTDTLSAQEQESVKLLSNKHLYHTYKNAVGNTEKIVFVAEAGDTPGNEQTVLEKCVHWYACYLGWEEECDDLVKSA
jgi:hypothetical protein